MEQDIETINEFLRSIQRNVTNNSVCVSKQTEPWLIEVARGYCEIHGIKLNLV
jgi:hypothetical protein